MICRAAGRSADRQKAEEQLLSKAAGSFFSRRKGAIDHEGGEGSV